MSLIRDTLIQIRTELGFETAKAFYRHLESRRTLDFNYAHYMKIEGAKALPSPAMVSTIGSALDPSAADRLTAAYCETLFPNQRHLFKIRQPAEAVPKKPGNPASARSESEAGTLIKQQFLTEAQIAAICRSRLHYSLFLVLTLGRSPVEPGRLSELLKVRSEEIAAAIRDLEKARLARAEDGKVASTSTELRFPKAESEGTRRMYDQMNLWDFEFDKAVGFESLIRKMMIRRVSSRYLGVILSHANVLMDLIRAAEEIHPNFNDDVLMLNLSLSRGQLPG